MAEDRRNSIIKETEHITRVSLSSGPIRTSVFVIKEESDYSLQFNLDRDDPFWDIH